MSEEMMSSELYRKTKIGVENKLLQRKKKRRKVAVYSVIGVLFLGVNATAYASSGKYRNWLSSRLGVSSKTTINIGKNITDKEINMEIVSYYRAKNTVVMSIKFQRSNEKSFSEDLNIETIKIDKNVNSSGEVLSSYSSLSEDKKSILTMLTMNVESEKISINAINLVSMQTGERIYDGNWKLEVDVAEQTGDIEKTENVKPVTVKIDDKEYKVKEVEHIANALFFKCDVKLVEVAEEARFSATYGGQVTLEYKNGEKNKDYYCIPDNEGNLVVLVWDANQLENISQIYIDGKEIMK